MEARRRLAVLCSHLRQIDLNHSPPTLPNRSISTHFSEVSTSNCVASSEDNDGDDDQPKLKSEKESEENGCVFCKIVRGESPAFKIFEDDVCLCILDLNPLNHGHSLIIPKSHYSSLEATPPSVVASMCSKIPFVSNAIMKATHCDAFNLLVNSGTAAGQVIFHTHVHIIPRKARDHLWTSKSFRRKPLKLDQQTTQLADRIREQLTLLNDNSEDGKA